MSKGIDYLNESYFAILGLTGSGKSLFLNAISGDKACKVANTGLACTQEPQLVSFVPSHIPNHRFNAIDTPGLDDTDNNQEKINILKNILASHPTIKKLIIVKKYNDLRLPESMQNAIIAFIEAFPMKNFWDHVIIVNSWANPHDESFTDYMEEGHEKFLNKILGCKKLLEKMKEKDIQRPKDLKEYFVCSKKIEKYKEIKEEFNKIIDDIQHSQLMFKDVKISEIKERSVESQKNKNFYIITKYKTITCIDFDDKKTELEDIIEEKEVAPKDCEIDHVDEEEDFLEKDEVKWYDVVSLGLIRAIRKTKKYQIYKVNCYRVGDKIIRGDKVRSRIEYR